MVWSRQVTKMVRFGSILNTSNIKDITGIRNWPRPDRFYNSFWPKRFSSGKFSHAYLENWSNRGQVWVWTIKSEIFWFTLNEWVNPSKIRVKMMRLKKWCIYRYDAYGVTGAIFENDSSLMIGRPDLYKPNTWRNLASDFHQKEYYRLLQSPRKFNLNVSFFLFSKIQKTWNTFETNDKFGTKSKFKKPVFSLRLISDTL